jgi:hypothetical protein
MRFCRRPRVRSAWGKPPGAFIRCRGAARCGTPVGRILWRTAVRHSRFAMLVPGLGLSRVVRVSRAPVLTHAQCRRSSYACGARARRAERATLGGGTQSSGIRQFPSYAPNATEETWGESPASSLRQSGHAAPRGGSRERTGEGAGLPPPVFGLCMHVCGGATALLVETNGRRRHAQTQRTS